MPDTLRHINTTQGTLEGTQNGSVHSADGQSAVSHGGTRGDLSAQGLRTAKKELEPDDTTRSPVVTSLIQPRSLSLMPKLDRFDIERPVTVTDSNYQQLMIDPAAYARSLVAPEDAWKLGVDAQRRSDDYVANSAIVTVLALVFCIVTVKFGKFKRVLASYFEELRTRRSRANVFDEPTVNERYISFILMVQFVICATVLVFAAVSPGGIDLNDSDLPALGATAVLVAGYYGFQIVAYSAVAYAFTSSDMMMKWLRIFGATQNLAGVGLIIPAMMAVFYPAAAPVLCYIGLGVYVVMRLFFIFKGFRIFYHNFFSWLYFILYLCALEIIPPVFVVKCSAFICSTL